MSQEELALALLKKSDSIQSQLSIAKELGCSVGKINYTLKALMDKGLIRAEKLTRGKAEKANRYLTTERGIAEIIRLTEKLMREKKKEYIELEKELKGINSAK